MMKFNSYKKNLFQIAKPEIRYTKDIFSKFIRTISLSSSLLLMLGLRGAANTPNIARVMRTSSSQHRDFYIFKASGDRNHVPVSTGVEIRNGGYINIPSSSSFWAAFGFFHQNNRTYGGLAVKAFGQGKYTFPCTINGRAIIGWRNQRDGYRDCSGSNRGLELGRKSTDLSATRVESGQVASIKQISNQGVEQPVLLSPGENTTLVRTNQRSGTTVTYIEECERWETPSGSGYSCVTRPQNISSKSIDIEVFQGDVLIKSEEVQDGVLVQEGQRYSYPSGNISVIDVGAAANSCEILQFLNPAYWSQSNESEYELGPIDEQLKQHREAVGVSGKPVNLSSKEQGIVDEMNLARTNPRFYATFLEERIQYFNGSLLELPGETPLRTREGASAYREAINFLRSNPALPPLTATAGMSQASNDLVNEQSANGDVGHGSGNNNMNNRLARHGEAGCSWSENVSYGPRTARDVVIQLIVEDGQPQRYHRANIFNLDSQVTGVACDSHPEWRTVCAITYANGYLEK